MNDSMDVAKLSFVAHMSLAQKRAFILRDQLHNLSTKHLDTFLVGICDPEPPNYQVVNGKIHPPFAEIVLKKSATRLDLGNVIFAKEGQADCIARVHLSIEKGKCEMSRSSALPTKDDDLNSVPIHAFILEQMIEQFVNKYKAIDTRKRSLNELRHVARGAASQPMVHVSPGKSLASLHLRSQADGWFTNRKDVAKRTRDDPLPKHVANKRKRIGLDDIPNTTKRAIFDNIPDQVKVDLFNNVLQTALPNFDNLLTAAWNVVYIHKNTGSEDRALFESINCLEKVLLEFSAHHLEASIKPEPQEKILAQVETSAKPDRVASTSPAGSEVSGTESDESQNPSPEEVAPRSTIEDQEVDRNVNDVGTAETPDPNTDSRKAHLAEQYDHPIAKGITPSAEEDHEAMLAARVKMLKGKLNTYQANPSSVGSKKHRYKDSPRHTPSDGGSIYPEKEHSSYPVSVYHEQQQKKHTFNSQRTSPQDQRHTASAGSSKPVRTHKPAVTHRQVCIDGMNEYFDDVEQGDRAAEMESPRQASPHVVFLGRSKLGAPKLPPNATGSAPVAPMEHIRRDSSSGNGSEKRGRPAA